MTSNNNINIDSTTVFTNVLKGNFDTTQKSNKKNSSEDTVETKKKSNESNKHEEKDNSLEPTPLWKWFLFILTVIVILGLMWYFFYFRLEPSSCIKEKKSSKRRSRKD